MIKRLKHWIKLRYCDHEFSISKFIRRADGDVENSCNKCGKIVVAKYGLAIHGRLVS